MRREIVLTEMEYAALWKERIAKSNWMSTKDKNLFLKFADDSILHEIGVRRIEKYRTDLCIANKITKKDIHGMIGSKQALEEAVKRINVANNYSPLSKHNCKRTLGSLYCFLHHNDRSLKYAPRDIKELVAHRIKASEQRVAKPIITRPEMRELLRFGNTLDKAIIVTLFDSGMRMGEFIQLRKSDLTITKEGVDIKVPAGKTGERRITVVEAKTYLARWLDEHPDKSTDAFLWVSPYARRTFTGKGIEKRINETILKLNEYRKKNGLPLFNKPHNPHNFRHSRASELGGEEGMTEQILCKFFGWQIGSDMPRTYLHLTDEQVKRAVLRVHGKAKNEAPKKIETHYICQSCKAENPLGANYCEQCGQPKDSDKQVTRIGQLESHLVKLQKENESLWQELEEAGLLKRGKSRPMTNKELDSEVGRD